MSISVTKLFGLEGDRWQRHANPVSVWTRFAVLPLLALAIWSRGVDRLVVADMKARDPAYAGWER